jgi:hypothetical protein
VTDVEYFGGATFSIDANSFEHKGNSWGSYINMKDRYYNANRGLYFDESGRFQPSFDPMYMHEFGHTFDSRLFGITYLFAIGIPSAAGAEWTEIRANRHTKRYFGNYFNLI